MGLRIRRQHLEACEGWLISTTIHLVGLILFALLLAPLAGNRSEVIEVESTFVDVGEELAIVELAALPTVAPESLPVSEPFPVESAELEVLHPGLVRSRGRGGAGQSLSTTGSSDGFPTGEGDGNSVNFFGTQASGNSFVYVLDISTSMDGARLRRAILELLRSIDQLHEHQQFYVITFSWKTRLMFDEDSWVLTPIAATLENKQRLRNWLAGVQTGSGTDPRDALRIGLRLEPDALFLLSDGEFNKPQQRARTFFLADPAESVIDVVQSEKSEGLPIHTVAFEIRQSEPEMKKIATETHGIHRFIPEVTTTDAGSESLRTAVMKYMFSAEMFEGP